MAKDCDYGDQSDDQIRDQVVQRSLELRPKLLEKGERFGSQQQHHMRQFNPSWRARKVVNTQ